MQKYRATINIRLKSGILDPQGQAISHALQVLGFGEIDSVRTGKLIECTIASENQSAAESEIEKACQDLFANPVIEDYTFRVQKLNGHE
ncbi:phosphoribosylformylglycinamidine synthase subunit PurS [candidate division KSB1 bacterium]|nr:phosphoribosylformylglycinamidine synthase subunit PurS [candidate division KSB1 bacterium]